MRNADPDMRVRLAAFDFLSELARAHGEVLPARALRKGFQLDGRRVPLQGPQGIFKPAVLRSFPLSITTAPRHPTRPPPYADAFNEDGTVTTRRRLHQRSFRLRVLRAYRERCALCRLKHEQLLDAAHIRPDADEPSEPSVSNGLALCKLHHAAFDRDFIGIRPDLVIQVRDDILTEDDGPMLVHGLQGFHGRPLSVPRRSEFRPRRDLLEERYHRFLTRSPR